MAMESGETTQQEQEEQRLQEKGWIVLSVPEFIPEEAAEQKVTAFLDKHPGYKKYSEDRLAPDIFPEGALNYVLVYDPKRTIVVKQVWRELPLGISSDSFAAAIRGKNGELLDSNIARGIYIVPKPSK